MSKKNHGFSNELKLSQVLLDLKVVVDRKGSLSAFARNFRFRYVPKHFGKNWPFCRNGRNAFFRFLSALTVLLRLVSAFGRNYSFLNELFQFRPKLFRSTTTWDNLSTLVVYKIQCPFLLPQPVRLCDLVRPVGLLPGVPVLPVELPPLLLLVRDGALAQPLPPENRDVRRCW